MPVLLSHVTCTYVCWSVSVDSTHQASESQSVTLPTNEAEKCMETKNLNKNKQKSIMRRIVTRTGRERISHLVYLAKRKNAWRQHKEEKTQQRKARTRRPGAVETINNFGRRSTRRPGLIMNKIESGGKVGSLGAREQWRNF